MGLMETVQKAVQERRRAGRPPQAVLTPARITRAALKLVTVNGYKGLTMATLAKSLNVAPSALYNHVSSKQDVLMLVEDHLMGKVDVSGFAILPWTDAVTQWARSYRDVFASHLPLIPVIALLPVTNAPATVTMYEAVTKGFQAAAWPEETIIDAVVALESFIYGSAYDVNAPSDIFDAGDLSPTAPHFTAAVAKRGAAGASARNDADAAFELGLRAMVAGLAATLGPANNPSAKPQH